MRNTFRLALALGAATTFGAALLLACSDDTSVSTTTDAGTDGGGVDAPRGDTSTLPDSGGPDTSPPIEAGPSYSLATFDTVLATELCKSLARCCYGSSMPAEGGVNDGGTFDLNACVNDFKDNGFQGSALGSAFRDSGTVTLDQASADDCVNKVKAIKCDLPGPDFVAARAACFGVYSGKLGAGQTCKGHVECQPGFFCLGQVDGGTGKCTAVSALNGPCGQNPDSFTEYEEACSYRAGGGSGNYCHWTDDPAVGTPLAASAWKCVPAAGAGSKCASSTWCKDAICDPDTLRCTSPDKLFAPQCTKFVKR